MEKSLDQGFVHLFEGADHSRHTYPPADAWEEWQGKKLLKFFFYSLFTKKIEKEPEYLPPLIE
jgi:hypothetical protein